MVFGSFIGCEKRRDLDLDLEMGKEVVDVEEGEISDGGASVEEISAEDFNKQDLVKVNNNNNNKTGSDEARVKAVHDLYSRYPNICRGYASGLYNMAWAQAVQNKPLNDIFVMEVDSDANGNGDGKNRPGSVDSKEVVVVDVEDGELEEGEIDADADVDNEARAGGGGGEGGGDEVIVDGSEAVSIPNSKLLGVRSVLEGVHVVNVAESFAETCTRLQSVFQDLPQVLSELAVSEKDDLVRLAFKAIGVVYSVFYSMDNLLKEQNKDDISRLLSSVKDQLTHLFSTEHMTEIQVMIAAVNSVGALGNDAIENEKNLQTYQLKTQEIQAVKAGELNSCSKPSHGVSIEVSEALKSGQSNVKGRGLLLPLLDLHGDHDADSLPSPTREAPSCFPVNKSMSLGEGRGRSGLPASKMKARKLELDSEDSKIHLYETDALKAVSSYQQKFGQSSFFTYDKLPSPTPSGDCEEEAVDMNDEVSSVPIMSSKPTLLDQLPVSSTSMDRSSSMHGLINSKIDVVGSASYPVKGSVNSRDPRLRLISSDASALDLNQPSMARTMPKGEYTGKTISRKQKAVEEPSLDVTVSKRLKSSLENPDRNTTEVRTAAGSGGWFEETTTTGYQLIEKNHLIEKVEAEPKNILISSSGNINMTSNGNEQALVTSSKTTVSIPALLKDIAVNPTMLLNILIEQQQRLAAEAKKKSADSTTATLHQTSSNSALGTKPVVSAGPSLTTDFLQSSVGMLPVSSQATSKAQSPPRDSGKIRMKPRDPRRILHGDRILQKSGSLGSEQFKATLSPTSNNQGTRGNVLAQKLEVRPETTSAHTQSIVQPDFARQFTSNLKNIADIMSVSQESLKHSSTPQNFSSVSVPPVLDRAEQKSVATNSQNLQAGIGSAPETFTSGSSQSKNSWGDFDYILDGYDEEEKAAIHRERARRINEQKKMFASRKLCLVLDLDHTLLNSAKFVEVDPVHDELLRKQEQEDREKPQRELFRFQHMGMWTKLRPGIWNFLEKASKLYELHVYTMGNKLYATEMAKLLDPKGVLFAGRVISRGDDNESLDGDAPKFKDLDGVLGMETSVVIIDDSVRVWPHHKPNLIVVERYIFFPYSRRQFGLQGPSLLERSVDETPETGTLACSLAVIERIHQNFFASQSLEDMDVRNILNSEQRKILAGCRIVFSRVIPVGEIPHLHPLWILAEQFGAVCTSQIDDEITHVVAGSLGTDKVNWAMATGKFVVSPNWLEASALLYRRANEHDFPSNK